jgi:hypothetical protein
MKEGWLSICLFSRVDSLGACFLEVATCIKGKDLSFNTLSQVKRGRSQPVLCCWGGWKKKLLVLWTKIKARPGLPYSGTVNLLIIQRNRCALYIYSNVCFVKYFMFPCIYFIFRESYIAKVTKESYGVCFIVLF